MRFPMAALFAFLSFYSLGQINLRGRITNSNNEPLSLANVLIKQDSVILKSAITDSLGNYHFSIDKPGKYLLSVSLIGFDAKELFLQLETDSVIDLKMQTMIHLMPDVTVAGKKPLIERRADRIIFNVNNSLTGVGNDVLEALQKAPNVVLINNNISLIGKSEVTIMVDDRALHLGGDDLINYLRSVSASNIVKIEVITNPPAKYDAQGNSGLINIVMKKNEREGYSASARIGYSQSTYPSFLGGGTINYNRKKFKLFFLIDARDGSNAQLENTTIYYPKQTWRQTNTKRGYAKSVNSKIGLDYQVSKKTSVGVSCSYTPTSYDLDPYIFTPIFSQYGSVDSTLITTAHTQINLHSNAVNLHLGQMLNPSGKKKLTIDADWFSYVNENDRDYANTNYYGNGVVIPNSYSLFLSGSNQGVNLYTFNSAFDFSYRDFNLTFGGKLVFINNHSQATYYNVVNGLPVFDSSKSNQFFYDENTQALFVSVNRNKNKWSYQMGLRGEYTQTEGVSLTNNQTTDNNYFKLFPTIFIVYSPDKENSFAINYGRRINRPSYSSLNPFRFYYSPYTYGEGNPFLQPSYGNNIELSHTYKHLLVTSLSFSLDNNRFSHITFVDSNTNKQITRPLNFLTAYNYQFSNTLIINKFKWLESNNQFQLFYTISKSKITESNHTVEGWGAYFSTDNQIVFNASKTVLGGVNFWYRFPQVNGIDHIGSFYSLDLGLRLLLNHKKIMTSIELSDILKTSRFSSSSMINNIKSDYNSYYDNRQFRIIIKYSFGNDKVVSQERKSANQEESRRL